MKQRNFFLAMVLVALFFLTGFYQAYAQTVNMPKTIIHHVTLKWKADATDAAKEKVMADLQSILSEIKGVKNLWIKSQKVQPKEYNQTFVIEFENQAALDAYAKHPKKDAWNKAYYAIRETSYNSVTSN